MNDVNAYFLPASYKKILLSFSIYLTWCLGYISALLPDWLSNVKNVLMTDPKSNFFYIKTNG